MSQENQNRITRIELEKLLLAVGFEAPYTVDKCSVFKHENSGIIILLPNTDPDQPVHGADLLSVHFRLSMHGLASPEILDALAAGKSPAA